MRTEILEGFSDYNGLGRVICFNKDDLSCELITGSFKNGQPDGVCTILMTTGHNFQGNFKNGKLDGVGKGMLNTVEGYIGLW